jgi:hypothetical protein
MILAKKNKKQSFTNQGMNFKIARETNPQADPEFASEFPTNTGKAGKNQQQSQQKNQQ